MSAAFYSLAEAFEVMRRQVSGAMEEGAVSALSAEGDEQHSDDLLTQMIQSLLSEADTPPREVEGVSEEFCDSKQAPFDTRPRFERPVDNKLLMIYVVNSA